MVFAYGVIVGILCGAAVVAVLTARSMRSIMDGCDAATAAADKACAEAFIAAKRAYTDGIASAKSARARAQKLTQTYCAALNGMNATWSRAYRDLEDRHADLERRHSEAVMVAARKASAPDGVLN